MSHRVRQVIEPSPPPFILWGLDEVTAPYVNRGVGGTATIDVSIGSGFTPHVSGPGPGTFAADFNASAGAALATLGGSAVLPPGNSFTMSMWIFRRAGGAGTPPLVSHSYGSTWPTSGKFANAIVLTSAHDGTWEPGFYLVGGGVIFFDVTSAKIPQDVWSHIAVTFDGTTLAAYLGGTLVQSATAAGAPIAVDWNGGAGVWMVGGNAVLHGSDLFEGKLYGARIDDRVLSPAEIAALAAEF